MIVYINYTSNTNNCTIFKNFRENVPGSENVNLPANNIIIIIIIIIIQISSCLSTCNNNNNNNGNRMCLENKCKVKHDVTFCHVF
jgi:hypothetical protein